MFTWNFQYISKVRVAEIFNQLMLNSQRGDILIRIHTSIHLEDEAVDLARFIKGLVPGAHIFGTSTSKIIGWGRMMSNQCIISVTQMERGYIHYARFSVCDDSGNKLPPEELCHRIKSSVTDDQTELALVFFSGGYPDTGRFVDMSNELIPGVRLIGGVADRADEKGDINQAHSFLFNETGWSDLGVMVAAFGGEGVESLASAVSGAEPIGSTYEITEVSGDRIVTIDGRDACEVYLENAGSDVTEDPSLCGILPYIYEDSPTVSLLMNYDPDRNRVWTYHNLSAGTKLRRAFIYDEKVIKDNRSLYLRIENFKKAETVFGYSCLLRTRRYPNSAAWELSIYKNSNMCGCVTNGEISSVAGKNVYANSTFVVAAVGENETVQEFNPFVFSHTDGLVDDNRAILSYLSRLRDKLGETDTKAPVLRALLVDYENKLLYIDNEKYANGAALSMDMKSHGYDRICMITVADLAGMRAVFSDSVIDMTYQDFVKKCASFAAARKYKFYILDGWEVAIGIASYLTSLPQFISDIRELERRLFESSKDYIAIIPLICVIDGCDADNIYDTYSAARVLMAQKNIQFMITKGDAQEFDREKIKERYDMVNVINYAIAHDKIIPFYQGIYDNKARRIHHFESLMRIEAEDGTILGPGAFLDVARTYGHLYDRMSFAMIKKVLIKFKDVSDISVSMNLGIRDIKNHEIISFIYDFLRTCDHPESFIFEILENEDVDDYEILTDFVDKIHDLGGNIAIDDFGSGFSNLQHILSIDVDYLKIDGSIIRKCCDSPEAERLIALITSWKNLGSRNFRIIAEFVEDESIQKIMKRYKVDYSQGYYFSKPAPEPVLTVK